VIDVSKHLFGLVLTPLGVAANNRGETEGNTTTLQKLVWRGAVHTTVSAEAIRAAIRRRWQEEGLPVNRTWVDETRSHTWQDEHFGDGGRSFIDDDVLGFMSARAAAQEANPEEATEPAGGRQRRRARGTTDARRARLEVTRAVSIDPWPGDVTFNAASPGATPTASRTGQDPVPYAAEIHSTRYQYGFALTPDDLHRRERALAVLDAIAKLSRVAGNHARFLFDFSPESLVLRWTDDPAPRLLYAFERDGDGTVRLRRLVDLVEAGDVAAEELWVAGAVAESVDAARLRERGAHVGASVRAAVEEVKRLVAG
jgi:CRISPR-associated protein Cst2